MRLTNLFCKMCAPCVRVSERPTGAWPKGGVLSGGLRATRIRLIAGVCICGIFASGEWLHGQTVRVGPAAAADKAQLSDADSLAAKFSAPPLSTRPWAYWWWLNANVTRQSITRDLEAMKSVGLGGFLLFDVTSYGHDLVPPPERSVGFMSPEWRQLVHHAMVEAHRLGLQMSMNLSTSGGSLQAPWDMGPDAPKELVWRAVRVTGPVHLRCQIDPPVSGGFHRVALLAARVGPGSAEKVESSKPRSPSISFTGDWTSVAHNLSRSGTLTELDAKQVANTVVDLTPKIDEQGQLSWDAEAGDWVLLQFAWQLIPERGNDVDILNVASVRAHWQRMGKVILEDAGPLAGQTLRHFYNVSWEGTSPSWTPGFKREFHKYRGYDMQRFLPVLAGYVVNDRAYSERFRRDYCRTLSDCFVHNCYETFTDLCHQSGIEWHSESGGPWRDFPLFQSADQLEFWGRNDMPQAEFWVRDPIRTNVRRAAMAAHIYAKPLVSVEAFTHMNRHWSSYPAILKPLADQTFCDGANQFIWHTFSASPAKFGKPGIVYFAGTHLNPNVTWWPMARPFVDYLARCQSLLQQGRFVADVCCYTTDRNQQNWGRDKQWDEHSSLMLPQGYTYDLLSAEALVDRVTFVAGRLRLPGGMSYRLLVVDLATDVVPPAVLRKIQQLAEAGATVVLGSRRPKRAPGLTDYPMCDQQTAQFASALWGAQTDDPRVRKMGRGKIITNIKMATILSDESVLPDCDTAWEYIHRQTADTDIFFLAGSGHAECTFRVAAKRPELWDPATGCISPVLAYHTTPDGRTVVPLELPKNGSTFVVFRKPSARPHLATVSGPDGGLEATIGTPSVPTLRFWKSGRYQWTTSRTSARVTRDVRVPPVIDMDGPWHVSFDPAWGGPATTEFDRLIPWNEHLLPGIKYYSGKATYRTTIQISPEQAASPARLSLGNVMCVARVRINGHDKGTLWTFPWTVDVTGDLQAGKNSLEVEVINTWVNRLIGDAALAPDKRLTKTIVRYEKGQRTLRVFQAFGSSDPLMPSGLLGPVRIEFGNTLAK